MKPVSTGIVLIFSEHVLNTTCQQISQQDKGVYSCWYLDRSSSK